MAQGDWRRQCREDFWRGTSRLPVEYVGEGRVAVSKTIIDFVPVPDGWPEDRKIFGAAQGMTMLIEGKSGKVIKESEAFVYEHNPPLKIP